MEIKMQTRSLIISAPLICVLVLGLAVVALAADPFIGTWKLNIAKSKTSDPGQMPKSEVHTNVVQGNAIKMTFDGVDSQGKEFQIESAGAWDGKDIHVKGDQSADTVSLKKADANTVDVVTKKSGKKVATYRTTISKDGKTMTMVGNGKNEKGQEWSQTMVLDKQ
jgi:hypothetical protein